MRTQKVHAHIYTVHKTPPTHPPAQTPPPSKSAKTAASGLPPHPPKPRPKPQRRLPPLAPALPPLLALGSSFTNPVEAAELTCASSSRPANLFLNLLSWPSSTTMMEPLPCCGLRGRGLRWLGSVGGRLVGLAHAERCTLHKVVQRQHRCCGRSCAAAELLQRQRQRLEADAGQGNSAPGRRGGCRCRCPRCTTPWCPRRS